MSRIVYYGYSAFVIYADKGKLVIDPGVDEKGESIIPGNEWESVDLIAVTNGDDDHAKMASRIAEFSHSTMIAHEDLESDLAGPDYLFQPVRPGEEVFLQGIRFQAFAATRGPAKGASHIGISRVFSKEKLGKGNMSLLVEVDGRTIIHLGDTLLRADWQEWQPDVLMVPVGGTVTLDPDEAIQAVNIIKPKIAIPIHYNIKASQFKLSQVNVEAFREVLEGQGFDCRILSPGEFVAV